MKNKKIKIIFLIITIFCLVYIINLFISPSEIFKVNGMDVLDLNITKEVSKEEASQAINDSRLIIEKMQELKFSTDYENDTLIEAIRVFEQAKYAEILRRNETNLTLKNEAKNALKLIDWKTIGYSNVLEYTNKIKNRFEEAFLIYDKLSIVKINIDESSKLYNTSEASNLFIKANEEFYADRFDTAQGLLEDIKTNLEIQQSQNTVFNSLKNASKNFFQNYWPQILLVLFFLILLTIILYRQISRYLLKQKIERFKIESKVLLNLMKKVQTEMFEENKISELTYNIRMKKYKERSNFIKQQLPVLEERLRPSKIL